MEKQTKRTSGRRSARLPQMIIFGVLGLIAAPTLVRAWSEPLSAPTTYGNDPTLLRDTLKFLNASSATQQKKGTLSIGTTDVQVKLCLNSDPNFPAADPVKCISSWYDLRNSPYLHLGQNAAGSSLAQYDDYAAGPLVSIKNNITLGQRFALIAEANPAAGSTALTSYGYIPGAGYNDFNYAGYFSGSVLVGTNAWNSATSLCLNSTATAATIVPGITSKGCISKWSDLYFSSSGVSYVQLASTGTAATPQTGQAQASSGLSSGGLVVGSTSGLPLAYTCGDTVCSANTSPAETATSCPIDCAGVFSIATFSASPGNGRIYFDSKTWSNAASQKVIVLRKDGSAPTSAPQDGTAYSVGQRIGDATVVFSPSTYYTANTPFFNLDTGLQNGHTYYYVAYPANSMPRYGTGTNPTSATPQLPTANLDLLFTYPNAIFITVQQETFGAIPNANPQSCQTDCTLHFVPGSRINLSFDVMTPGYSFLSYGGDCVSQETSCNFTLGGSGFVQIFIQQNGLGGAGGGGPGLPPDGRNPSFE